MSLHPQLPSQIPPDTVRVAHAAFPKGNIYMRMRDELGTIYTDGANLLNKSGRNRRKKEGRKDQLVFVGE